MTRVLFLSNIPTPYQIDFFGAVAKSVDVLAVFLWGRESNRDWNLAEKPWLRILGGGQRRPIWRELRSLLEEFKPDHVLVGGYRLPLSFRLRWYCVLHGICFNYWLEKPLPVTRLRAVLRRCVWALTLPFASQIFCIGREAIKAYGPYARKTINLPYSVDASRYFLRSSDPNRPLKCLYIGQYIVRKGVPELLEAFAGIAPDQATLSLVGSGELGSMVSSYTTKYPHISEYGFVEPEELPRLISQYDLLLVPSRHDGWAVVVVEAMIAGLPVISTRGTGAFMELGKWEGGEQTGSLCTVDIHSIRTSVIEYVNRPERIAEEGCAAHKVILVSPAESENAAKVLLTGLNLSCYSEESDC